MFINLDENSVKFDGVIMNGKAISVELVKSELHKNGKAYSIDFGTIVSVVCETRVVVTPKKEPAISGDNKVTYKAVNYNEDNSKFWEVARDFAEGEPVVFHYLLNDSYFSIADNDRLLKEYKCRNLYRKIKADQVRIGAPKLIETDGLQYKISDYGNQIHNLSCGVDDEDLQQELGAIADRLWQIKVETPEEKAARERDSGIMAMMEVALEQPIGGEPLEAYRGNAAYRICEKLYDAQYRK